MNLKVEIPDNSPSEVSRGSSQDHQPRLSYVGRFDIEKY